MDGDGRGASQETAEKVRQADIDRARARGVDLHGPGFARFGHANGHGLADTTTNVAHQNVAGAFRSVQWARPALRALWGLTKGVGRLGKWLLRSLLGGLSRLRNRRQQGWQRDDQITRPELSENVAEDTAAAVRGIDPVELAAALGEALKDHPEIPEAVRRRLSDPEEVARILQGIDAGTVNQAVRTNAEELYAGLNEVWGERLGGIARFPEYRDFEATWKVAQDERWQITNASADDLMAVMASAAASTDPEARTALGQAEAELRERSPLMYAAYERGKRAAEAGEAAPSAETRAQAVLDGLAKAALYDTEARMPVEEFHRAKVTDPKWLSTTDREQVKDMVDALQAKAEAGDAEAPHLLDTAVRRLSAENPAVAGRYLEIMHGTAESSPTGTYRKLREETAGHPFEPGAKLKDAAAKEEAAGRSEPKIEIHVHVGETSRGADRGGERSWRDRAGDDMRRHGAVKR
ncbi:hypothetical protein [Marinitenerispora sediminis]|uniref:Uncharacterized protein n=1 Tax=Marinitenerispora sediminis TaxID=1931232 RepID=A0A368T1Y2_9ACTN|nr:hypothetical protein [Marinitenerispora sediminis]RCV50975.1 hypothetical protein DEF23_21220 [Marinitenerispora sediminis]RCV53231.1 hypothetical protein DEF28_10840 [Marinitenerispora sediminis]RCV54374.1 hypothetical protein DEF24_19335 [Marinitenerispora sediminis]